MATNNAINKNFPLAVVDGGTSDTSFGVGRILVGSGTGAITDIFLGSAAAQILRGDTGNDPDWATSVEDSFTFTSNTPNVTRTFTVENTANYGSSPHFDIEQVISYDTLIRFTVDSIKDFTFGYDDTSGRLTFSNSDTLGTNNVLEVPQSAYPLLPAQTRFGALDNGTISNVTGDGTVYTVVFGSSTFNIGSDYDDSTTYTAPIDGKYLFKSKIHATGASTSNTLLTLAFVTTSQTYTLVRVDPAGWVSTGGTVGIDMDLFVELSAGDTVEVDLTMSGGSQVVDINFYGFFGALIA